MSSVTFPKGFIWGSATSSYQIEGATREDGRGESIWDRFAGTPSNIKDGTNGDVACDHYHRWREDLDLLRRLGHAAYRFSLAWPRILPRGRGPANPAGLDFYSRLVDGLLERGIVPFATLFHWDLPQALQDDGGGWANRATVTAFAEYADVVTRRLGDRVKHWITHNEPWCSSMVSHQKGVHAPGVRDWRIALAAAHHILLSHGQAVPIIRTNSPGATVGITLNLSPSVPASPSPEDADAARRHDGYMNRWFLEPVFRGEYPADIVTDYIADGHLPDGMPFVRPGDLRDMAAPTDFLGVNYYNRHVARSDRIPEEKNAPRTVFAAPRADWTDIGWEVHAPGMFEVLMRVHLEYRPRTIYITENGAAYSDAPDASKRIADVKRIRYLRDHLLEAKRALDNGVPLDGYFAWSLLDNYEWDHGYSQRFGLTWVDYATQERIPKDSALWYQKVIEANAVPPE